MTTTAPETHSTLAALPIRTIVATWESAADGAGETVLPDLRPVVITVQAASSEEAIEAASDKLQDYYGPHVEAVYRTDLTRDDWFGRNNTDPLLQVCAVFIGAPILDDDEAEYATYVA